MSSKAPINDKAAKTDENSSSESLYEIKLNEFVRKSEISDFDLRSLVVRCSSCGSQINHHAKKDVKRHRKLDVITCKDCYEFYGSSEFSQDESGYNYCTWCGNGGKLIICDYCPNGFCKSCIRRNFGRGEISVTMQEGWRCYVCDNSRLKPKRKFCDLIIKSEEKIKKERKVTQPSKVISEEWLQSVFDETDEACRKFHRKMTKLKSIGLSKSKSLKHIVKKIEDLINTHRADSKRISVTLTNNFQTHIQTPLKVERKSDSGSNHSVTIVDLEQQCDTSIAEKDKGELNDSFHSCCIIENESKDEKMQAKLKLLKSSSESDSGSNARPTNEKQSLLNIDNDKEGSEKCEAETDKNAESRVSENACAIESSLNSNGQSKQTVKRKLSFDFSDFSQDDFSQKLDIDELELRINDETPTESSKAKSETEDIDPETDPKLKCASKVELTRCDDLLKDGKTYVRIAEDDQSDIEAKLDNLVNSLCKLPKQTSRKSFNSGRRKPGPLSKAAARSRLLESSSSISLSSEEDEDQKKIIIAKNTAIKDNLLEKKKSEASDSSSSTFSLSPDTEEEKKKKSNKVSKKEKSDDSSDDFVPVKKKKYDKLLHAPLFSDEESKSKPKKDNKSSRKRKVLLSSDEEGKRKNDSSRSDSSVISSDDENQKDRKQSKKRRRIKRMASSSNEDNEEEKDTPAKGRKSIRKIISQKQLAQSTKEAQLEEKERRKRIQEKQKLYNKIEDLSMDGKEIVTRKMVLEVDQNSKEEIVEIHPDLVCKLKPHQVNGVKFMWECTVESVKDLNKPGSGCILAHCMGLGKTLQVIAFLHTCLTNDRVNQTISKGMIVCPYNTALNWASEFDYWLKDVENEIKIHQLTAVKSNLERLDILRYWFEDGGVIILSYDLFRRLSSEKITKLKAKEKRKMHEYLLDPGPDIIVCDEGHVLKNEKSAISVATGKLRTRRRIVLTGTPLQNNLKEYHCMLSFVKPNLLGTHKEFCNRFVHPIINGQYDDSDSYDVKLMKKRIHILHKLLEGCVQMYKDDEEEEDEFIDDDASDSKSTSSSGDTSDDDKLIEKIKKDQKKVYRTRSKVDENDEKEEEDPDLSQEDKQWYHEFISDDDKCNIELSGKMILLLEILKESEIIRDKVLLFSQSLLTLDAIEDILEFSSSNFLSSKPTEEEEKNQDVIGTWVKGVDYFRMDGSTSADFRKSYIDMFNDKSNERARFFLISTRAGSLGTNLVGANRVIIFDTSWNPSHDVQAIFRVYRFGQLKPVYIYRLLAQGTMEEKIYDRQVTKLSLSCRVVDEQQIDRHFSAADLAELYTFDRNPSANRPTPMVPKDRLLAELLIKYGNWIGTYHEHDSLLQNQTEEELTEEERQAAWTEYENEREGRAPSGDINSMDNLVNEPDYNKDYEGQMIPDLKYIIQNLYERIHKEFPGLSTTNVLLFKRKLLQMVTAVRNGFQQQQVKVLRKKQETINYEQLKLNQEQMRQAAAAGQTTGNRPNQQYEQFIRMQNLIRTGQLPRGSFVQMGRFPRNIRQTLLQQRTPRGPIPFTRPVYPTRSSAAQQQPVITVTEADDDSAPTSFTDSNVRSNKSTVVIEEIS